MGRAQGGPAAVSTDAFSQVLGTRRGPMEVDTLLAVKPSAAAALELQRLVSAPGFAETQEALTLLYRHRALVAQRPLLSTLAAELCRRAGTQTLRSWSPQTRELMVHAGLRNEFAEQLFSDAKSTVHICAAGRDFGVDDSLQTACGVPLTRSDISQVRRGGWARPASAQLQRCSDCAEHADSTADCQETDRYPALAERAETQCVDALASVAREKLDGMFASGQPPTEADLASAAHSAYPQLLLDFAAQQMHDGGPATVARAVGRHHWKTLRDAAGTSALDPAVLWPLDEWREHLMPYAPYERRAVDPDRRDDRRAKARDGLFHALAADLGIKRPGKAPKFKNAKRR